MTLCHASVVRGTCSGRGHATSATPMSFSIAFTRAECVFCITTARGRVRVRVRGGEGGARVRARVRVRVRARVRVAYSRVG